MAVDPKASYEAAMLRRQELAQRKYVVPKKSAAQLQAEADEVRAGNAPEKARVMGPRDMFSGAGGSQVIKTFAPGEVGNAKVEERREQESQESADARGDAQVQTRDASQQLGAEGEEPGTGDSDRTQRERPVTQVAQTSNESACGEELWVSRQYIAESREKLDELIPADARAVTRKRVWQAWALVRKE